MSNLTRFTAFLYKVLFSSFIACSGVNYPPPSPAPLFVIVNTWLSDIPNFQNNVFTLKCHQEHKWHLLQSSTVFPTKIFTHVTIILHSVPPYVDVCGLSPGRVNALNLTKWFNFFWCAKIFQVICRNSSMQMNEVLKCVTDTVLPVKPSSWIRFASDCPLFFKYRWPWGKCVFGGLDLMDDLSVWTVHLSHQTLLSQINLWFTAVAVLVCDCEWWMKAEASL